MSTTTQKEVTILDRKFEKKSFEKTNSYESWDVLVTLSEAPNEAWQKSFLEQWKILHETSGMTKIPEVTFKKAVLSVSGLRIETASLFSRVRKTLKLLYPPPPTPSLFEGLKEYRILKPFLTLLTLLTRSGKTPQHVSSPPKS